MKQQSVTVSQFLNPKYNSGKPLDASENPEHIFKVEKSVNTLRVKIGQWLTPSEVQSLIEAEIDTTIIPAK